jgi:glycosyltransferase involved in cell wall biosynthesis
MNKDFNCPKCTVTFVTPTFNSEVWIDSYVASIYKQKYPKNLIDILFIDGGSTDKTYQKATQYGIKIINNDLILGDPGFAIGAESATGDFMVFMGHDNELVQDNWIESMIAPMLANEDIVASFPHLENRSEDTWLTRYVNKFTDPGNHFVYEYANNPLTFSKCYKKIEENKSWVVYDFRVENHPILEFEQGFTIRRNGYARDSSTWYCGIMAVLGLIKSGKKIAYVPIASNYHTTLNKGILQFIKKHRWAINYNLDKRETFGIYKEKFGLKARKKYISSYRKCRIYLYPFYGISFVVPLLRSLYMLAKDRDGEWIYHAPITFISAAIIWFEAVRIIILRGKPITDRY